MNVRHNCRRWIATVTAVMVAGFCTNMANAQFRGPDDSGQGVDVLTRGPVHEAFAETVTFDPQPGVVVSMDPREAIEEVPPDQRPDGANVTWIPGYWAWDDERDDFLWVSGIWRDLPPGRQWMPGYWSESARGSQWISGYWEDAGVSHVEYLPEPPLSIETGPSVDAPAPNQSWMPGSWIWRDGRYAWRPGYWAAGRSDWVWVPAHYVWTPRGYVFSDGYWDHTLERRGVLFAPVYFEKNVYARRGYSYSPSFAINLTVLSDNLFVRPRYTHYYFGDYYAPSYRESGYYASFSVQFSRRGYDPIYAHNRWEHRRDPEWGRRVAARFQHRRDHEDARPFRTLAAQISFDTRREKSREDRHHVATAYKELVQRKDSRMRFRPVAKKERQQFARRERDIQQSRGQRKTYEAKAGNRPTDMSTRRTRPVRDNLPNTPIVARPANQLEKGQSPPRRHQVPSPDPKVEAKPRRQGGGNEPAKAEKKEKSHGESKNRAKDEKKTKDAPKRKTR